MFQVSHSDYVKSLQPNNKQESTLFLLLWGIKASLSTTEDIVPLPLSFAYRTKMSSTAGVLLKDTGNNRKQRERWEIKNCVTRGNKGKRKR